MKVNNTVSYNLPLENGVPQGSVLSPTLFLVAMDSVAETIRKPVNMSLFADDLLIYCSGKNVDTIQGIIQNTISRMETWGNQNGFTFSTEKTKVMLFTRRTTPQTVAPLQLNGTILAAVNQHRFLGLIFDTRLTWKSHIEHLRADCSRRLSILKVLSHHQWGAHEDILLRSYRALIRSKLDYGCIIYQSAPKYILRKLNSIHNSAIRLALSAFPTSPTLSLYRESGELPLWLRRKQLSLLYAIKTLASPGNPARRTLTGNGIDQQYSRKPRIPLPLRLKISRDIGQLTLGNVVTQSFTEYPPWTTETISIDTSLSLLPPTTRQKIAKQRVNTRHTEHDQATTYYTDASKNDADVGFALITPTATVQGRLPATYGVHSAELYALLQAVTHLEESPSNQCLICTDSLSALSALASVYTRHPFVQRIHSTIEHLNQIGKKVAFLWIPSHSGIEGNDLADQLAHEACQLEDVFTQELLVTDRISQAKQKVQAKWQTLWTSQQRSKLRDVDATVEFVGLSGVNRREASILRRLRIGHTSLTHSHILSGEDEPLCEQCNVPVTVEHVLRDCPKYTRARSSCQLGDSLQSILNIHNEEARNRVLNFLKHTNLQDRI